MFIPRSNDRAVFVGPTGSGKTVLAKTLLDFYKNVIIVDPKHQWEFTFDKKSPTQYVNSTGYPIYLATDLSSLEDAMNKQVEEPHHIVYRVPTEHLLRENCKDLDRVADLVLQRGHTTLYYDELYYVANGSDFQKRAPNYFFCVTTGRSKKIGVWGSVQRPSWIPLIALTETEVRATFFLRNADDRLRMDKLMGDGVPWDKLQKFRHSFAMANDLETTGVLKLQLPSNNKPQEVSTLHE